MLSAGMGSLAILGTSNPARSETPAPELVPTFECIGITWSPAAAKSKNSVAVHYREVGHKTWRRALDLWLDNRNAEYRGSIVGLKPGTRYRIRLTQANTGTRVKTSVTTWTETRDWPIGEVIKLPARSTTRLFIQEGGTPDAYKLYEPAGDSAEIDVQLRTNASVAIAAPYVIVRGLTLKGGVNAGVIIGSGAHDVVVEGCEISEFGVENELGWTTGNPAGVLVPTKQSGVTRLVIQANDIHDPNGDTNAWTESRPDVSSSATGFHPTGANGIFLTETKGNNVIRHNHIHSSENHYFNDGIGGSKNDSKKGAPGRDSDIYGNRVSECWDDGIEAEGGGRNVRIWGNLLNNVMVGIGHRQNRVGPSYVFRNVIRTSQFDPNSPRDEDRRGQFFKAGTRFNTRCYIFHNTIFQEFIGNQEPDGSSWGIRGGAKNLVSRNNIFHIAMVNQNAYSIRNAAANCDFDYDLFNGAIVASGSQEANGILGTPTYRKSNGPDEYFLTGSSLGVNAGQVIPNFNDGFSGSAPDIGAFERGQKPPIYGIRKILISG
ncbi:MAG: right-handed parallel beta-helix repeat-containing protein [Pseudomonadota bacterium]